MKQTVCKNISPYLADAPDVVVKPSANALNASLPMVYGNGIHSGGALLLSDKERDEMLAEDRSAEAFIRQCIGGDEILAGRKRWCLWLYGSDEWKLHHGIAARVEQCRKYRISSKSLRHEAKNPETFGELRQPSCSRLIVVPKISSERRWYIPMVYVKSDVVVTASALMVPDAMPMHFGLLISAMHMAWMKTVGGRIGGSYQYSVKAVYNPFPWPDRLDSSLIEPLVNAVMQERRKFKMSLGEMYNTNAMPYSLKTIHQKLDSMIDALYNPDGFKSDSDRLMHLLRMYEEKASSKSLDINQWC